MDNNLFIEELPEDKQPGTYVRRVNGKELTDDEMITHYIDLVKEYGGRLTAKWVYGIVICNDNGNKKLSWSTDHFYFVDKPSEKRNPGYPLDSISIIPEFDKYLTELSKEEKIILNKKDCMDDDIQFILDNIQNQVFPYKSNGCHTL